MSFLYWLLNLTYSLSHYSGSQMSWFSRDRPCFLIFWWVVLVSQSVLSGMLKPSIYWETGRVRQYRVWWHRKLSFIKCNVRAYTDSCDTETLRLTLSQVVVVAQFSVSPHSKLRQNGSTERTRKIWTCIIMKIIYMNRLKNTHTHTHICILRISLF